MRSGWFAVLPRDVDELDPVLGADLAVALHVAPHSTGLLVERLAVALDTDAPLDEAAVEHVLDLARDRVAQLVLEDQRREVGARERALDQPLEPVLREAPEPARIAEHAAKRLRPAGSGPVDAVEHVLDPSLRVAATQRPVERALDGVLVDDRAQVGEHSRNRHRADAVDHDDVLVREALRSMEHDVGCPRVATSLHRDLDRCSVEPIGAVE